MADNLLNCSKAVRLFPSVEKALDFVNSYDLDVAKGTLLQHEELYGEAAEVHITEGRNVEAIQIFLKHLADKNCTKHAAACALRALWRHISFAVSPAITKTSSLLKQWLELASCLDPTFLAPNELDEV